jgi:PAS domain S-box-containing protein
MPSAQSLPFAELFDAAPDAMLLVDGSGTVEAANARTADVFGYDPAALEGEPVERLVPDDVAADHVPLRDAFFEDPTRRPMGADVDLRGQRADGSTFPVDVSLSPVEVRGEVHVLATVRDVSAHQGLRRKYRALLAAIPDAVVVVATESGEVVEVNERATTLFGRGRSTLVGSHHTALHPTGQRERYRDLFERQVRADRALDAQHPDGDDILVETADEEHVPVEIHASAAELDGHDVVVAVFRDVTDRRARERDLERQLDRVETLTSVLSHDLRGPLNVAEGYLGRVRDGGDPAHLDRVDAAHERMETILDDVLTMLRDTGDVETEPVHLGTVATECWSVVTRDRGTLTVAADAAFEADPRQVKHLFENLFRNAVEHGSTGSQNAGRSDDAVEHASTGNRTESGDGVAHGSSGGRAEPGDVTVRVGLLDVADGFYVADDGPGIPEDEREAVLEPGYSTARDGTGLGLVIVREVAGAHGWDLAVTEGADGGARFEFSGVSIRDAGPV